MPTIQDLGVGLGYRSQLRQAIIRGRSELDFLEIITDTFVRNVEGLDAVASLFKCIPHSLNLSVGSEVEAAYLSEVAGIVERVDPPWHSDHLAYTKADGLSAGHLIPVPYTPEKLEEIVHNVRRIQDAIGRPFALENITMPFYWPLDTMDEAAFLRELVTRTGCHLLLDLENVRINADNHRDGLRDAREFLDRLPLERVVQVHIAGGTHADGLHHDTHSGPVSDDTWDLLSYLCEVRRPPAVLLERDSGFTDPQEIFRDIRHARAIWEAAA